MQIYTLLLKAATKIPETRLISWEHFQRSGTSNNIKKYILLFLSVNRHQSFTCREISNISGIEIGSLTSPLLSLKEGRLIDASGRKVSPKNSKPVIAYKYKNR